MTQTEYWDKVESIIRDLGRKLEELEKESGEKFTGVEVNFSKRPDRAAFKLLLQKLQVRDIC
ncbi:hypothetical protein [Adhaeribacter terreus]|uniref:Uncharacterized protein n=1 Tax=Adhaeribacter terreus TaxID=529703 RepID=A0ABW0EER8_9BACT